MNLTHNQRKIIGLSVLSLLLSFFAYSIATQPNITNQYFTNYTNITGTGNHANLTNLNWSVAGHIIDSDIIVNHYNITNSKYIYTDNITSNEGTSKILLNNSLNLYIIKNTTSALGSIIMNGANVLSSSSNLVTAVSKLYQYPTEFNFQFDTMERLSITNSSIKANTTLDMQNHSITNANYGLFSNLVDRKAEGYVLGTTYQNNLSIPIFVMVTATHPSGIGMSTYLNSSSTLGTSRISHTQNAGYPNSITFIVPAKYYYKVSFASGSPTLNYWYELI